MRVDFEEYVIDIAADVSEKLGGVLDVSTTRWISRPDGKELVKDATLAFYVDGKNYTDDIVLLVSNSSFPDAVAEDVARARDVALRVSQTVRQHIIAPLCEGNFGKQTYAAFSRLSPFSESRTLRLFQKPKVLDQVLPWLRGLAMDTKECKEDPVEYERYFTRPLTDLRNDEDISVSVREFASSSLDFVLSTKPDFFTAAQHGDFWIGNVFFERRMFFNLNPALAKFFVIDWRGSRLDGYPCVDLLRFSSSIYKAGSSKIDYSIEKYLDSLKISKIEMGLYCLIALGRLGSELGQFPKRRYSVLCDGVLEYVAAHCLSIDDL